MNPAILLIGGALAGAALLLGKKKTPAPAAPPPIAPPLQGVQVQLPTPGSVLVLPDEDDVEPEQSPPSIVIPNPLTVPPGGPPPFVPPTVFASVPPAQPAAPTTPAFVPPVLAPTPAAPQPILTSPTLPGIPVQLPTQVQDVLDAAGVPVVVPPIFPTASDDGPGAPPVILSPPPIPPPPAAEQQTDLADDTEAVLAAMLGAEQSPSWKRNEPVLTAWQAKRGLVADGAFGPGSALRMAQETGLLPIVRFWPRTSLQHIALPKYQSDLRLLAASAPEPRRSQLLAAATRERGQGFGSNQSAISPLIVFEA